MIDMLCRFNTMLTCYNVKVIAFTWFRYNRHRKI